MLRRGLLVCASILAICGCEGPAGPAGDRGAPGTKGEPGTDGTTDPSVSAVTPSLGYLGRTIDLAVSGYGTAWAGDTTVSFSDPGIKVNSVTAGSETGLLVNITIAPDVAEGPVDVMVTDMIGTETYNGAFKIASPLDMTVMPPMGLPQGGLAILRVQMLDATTPFDAKTVNVTFGSSDVGLVGISEVTPFGMDVMVESDVLAATGGVDITVTSGEGAKVITSPRKGAFQIEARMPTALLANTLETSELKEPADTLLYSYAPANANAHFVQFNLDAIQGFPVGMLVPSSGKLSDTIGEFGKRFAVDTQSTDPLYFLMRRASFDSPNPYSVSFGVRDVDCTPMTETVGNIDPSTANAIAALPALVSGDLLQGMEQSDDWFKFDVTGATMATPKIIHVATGGDPDSDMIAQVFDVDMFTPLDYTNVDGKHKDLEIQDITMDGTYYVRVMPGVQFHEMHSTYKLLVEVK